MTEESFDRVISVNTKGTMFLTQAVAKQMISQEPVDGRRGIIVNVSSCSSSVKCKPWRVLYFKSRSIYAYNIVC